MPLYRPNPALGEDDGFTVEALTGTLVRIAERAKDFDESNNAMLLGALRGLAAAHRKVLEGFEKKLVAEQKKALRRNAKVIERVTRPTAHRDPYWDIDKRRS